VGYVIVSCQLVLPVPCCSTELRWQTLPLLAWAAPPCLVSGACALLMPGRTQLPACLSICEVIDTGCCLALCCYNCMLSCRLGLGSKASAWRCRCSTHGITQSRSMSVTSSLPHHTTHNHQTAVCPHYKRPRVLLLLLPLLLHFASQQAQQAHIVHDHNKTLT